MRPDTYGRIAGRAQTQLGLITDPQLDAIGVSRRQRRTMLASGRWERRGRHVFVDAASHPSEHQRVLAAVLDVPGSVATGSTAAWLVGLRGFRPDPVQIVAKRGGNHRPTLGRLTETFWLPDHHRQVVAAVPCISDARIPFELAWGMHPDRLRRVVDSLISQRGLRPEDLARCVAETCRRGKPGSAEMRLVVDERLPGYVPPSSALEHAYADFCDRFDLPHGVRQLNVGGEAWVGRVDVAYPERKLLVELDSRRWHDTSTTFEHDRARTNELVRAGWRVIRITWRMLHDEPERVADLIRTCLCGGSGR